ncbi:hypothetical protein [Nonomuraea sp. bgisy101]|uniref:hypothetical protein n=1 Tax=Nonomuraea sp. bgisy101 TaxID=3413784 RepID=UPI003D71A1FC
MDDDELPSGVTRQEWTDLEPEDRLLLALGSDREQTPEERTEAARQAIEAYREWLTGEQDTAE